MLNDARGRVTRRAWRWRTASLRRQGGYGLQGDALGRSPPRRCVITSGKTISYFSSSNFSTTCTSPSLFTAQNSKAAVELTKSTASEGSLVQESTS
jgi:hypothetical protein